MIKTALVYEEVAVSDRDLGCTHDNLSLFRKGPETKINYYACIRCGELLSM